MYVDEKQTNDKPVDLNDDRFQSIYKDPNFNIDPTNPKYQKETNEKFLIEKRKKKIQK